MAAWTKERVEELLRLWNMGLSASAIASRMGDVTRNSVISKLHRSGQGRSTRTVQSSKGGRKAVGGWRKARATAKPVKPRSTSPLHAIFKVEPVKEVPEIVIPLHERKGILDLGDQDCRWPIGDPRQEGFHFCGRMKVTGLPYCQDHARRAFIPPKPKPGPKQPARYEIVASGNENEAGGGRGSQNDQIGATRQRSEIEGVS